MRVICAVALLACLAAVPASASAQGGSSVELCAVTCVSVPDPTGMAYQVTSLARSANPTSSACAAGQDVEVPVGEDASVTLCTDYREGSDGRDFTVVAVEAGGHVVQIMDSSFDGSHGCGSSRQMWGVALDGQPVWVGFGESAC